MSSDDYKPPRKSSQPDQVNVFTLPMLEWVEITAGDVQMPFDRDNPEQGPYAVTPFYIAKYPVTNAQFQAFIDDGGYDVGWYWMRLAKRELAPADPRWAAPSHPRDSVNWYEAIAFCRWLGEKTGLPVTLPTAMQWSRAAAGDSGWQYPYGEMFDKDKANTEESGLKQTTSVDHYPEGASPFGVLDMTGNIWEWCLNEAIYLENIETTGTAARAMCGGAWSYSQAYARANTFSYGSPDKRYSFFGFRVACPKPKPKRTETRRF